MNVLWLSHFVPFPPAGGALQRCYHLLQHAARRHDVHLVALNQPRLLATGAELHEARGKLAEWCASTSIVGLPSEQSRLHRSMTRLRAVLGPDPYDVVWLRSRSFQDAVAQAFATRAPDLVHVDTIGLWQYVPTGSRVPIVLGHHNIESELVSRRAAVAHPLLSVLLRRDAAKLRALERQAAAQASINIVVSANDAHYLHKFVPIAKIHLVDNGVDTTYWQPRRDESTTVPTLIFAGTLGWYPNRDAVQFLLKEIWPALLAKRPDHRLLLVGRDPPDSLMRAAMDTRVQVTGAVADVRPYMAAATIYVCPIRIGGGTRLKVLDALAMAKPLIATAAAVEGLDVVPNEHYLPAESVQEFVTQIRRLEDDPSLAARIGEAGHRRIVERYDWSIIGPQLDEAYSAAISGALVQGGEPES